MKKKNILFGKEYQIIQIKVLIIIQVYPHVGMN